MRYCLLLLTIGLGSILYGQNITLDVKEEALNKVLEQIENDYDVHFSFDAEQLSSFVISIQASNEPIESFLERLLAPYHLSAKRSKKNFFYIKSTRRDIVFILSNQENGEPIPYATINIKGSYKGNSSNEHGIGKLSFDQRDTAILVGAFGYNTITINPKEIKSDTVRLTLSTTSVDLKTVTILEYINRGIQLIGDISSPTLVLSDMDVLPGLPEADVLLSTQMLPGFESNNETAAGINVRGSDQAQTLIYWDRIPIYKPAHYFGQITSIIPSMTKEVKAYKNYIPSSFSGATSGLLNMTADDSIPTRSNYISNTTFTHSELSIKSPINKKLAIQIGGRLSYNHLVNTPLFNAYSNKLFDGVRELEEEEEAEPTIDSDLKFWDFSSKVIYEPNSNNYWSFSSILNKDELDYVGSEAGDSNQIFQDHSESFAGFNTLYKHRFNSNWSSRLSLSITDYDAEDNSTELFRELNLVEYDSSFISNELNSIEAKSALIYSGWEKNTIEFGYQLHHYETALSFRESSTYEASIKEIRSTKEIANGLYVLANIEATDRLLLRPQFRIDYFSKEEDLSINPVLNTQYKLGKGFWLKSSVGSYSQALSSINDATLSASNVSSGIWVLAGEDDTEVLKSRHGSLGILYQKKGWIIDLDFYTKKVEGISAINLFEESVNEGLDFELGESTTSGLDLMLKKNFGRYHTWLSYTYSKTQNTFDSLGNTFASSLDRPHQFRWVHTYIINQFEFSLGWTYKSGTPYTQGNEVEYNANDDEYAIIYDQINSVRLPVYHRMDFSFWYRFPSEEKDWNGVLGFSLMNVYNRENVWKRFYQLEDLNDDDIPEVEASERFFLGFTPNITLKLSFN